MNASELKQAALLTKVLDISMEEMVAIDIVTKGADKETMDLVANAMIMIATKIYIHAHPDMTDDAKAELNKFASFMRELSTEETAEITSDMLREAMTPTFAVSNIVSCQFGNASDSSGYERSTEVEVMAVQDRTFVGKCYLVRKVDDHNYLGNAQLSRDGLQVTGVLYCTNARVIDTSAWLEERCWTSLGFSKEWETMSEARRIAAQ